MLVKGQYSLDKNLQLILLTDLILISQWTSKETRYDYNLTIMKSPKPATDNRFKNSIEFLRYCGGHFENGDR
jgi:hypothetical protein